MYYFCLCIDVLGTAQLLTFTSRVHFQKGHRTCHNLKVEIVSAISLGRIAPRYPTAQPLCVALN